MNKIVYITNINIIISIINTNIAINVNNTNKIFIASIIKIKKNR